MSAVLYRLLSLVIALAGCSRAEEKPDTSTKYTNLSVPFSARVPAGWSLEDTTYVVTWASTVFALARNHLAAGVTPDFPGDEWRTTGPSPTSQLQLAKRVPPGGVVVMFCLVRVGPPVDCNFRRDTVGSSLASVVDSLGMSFSKPFHLGFSKWGVTWRIEVLARNVTSDDSLAVRELLRSIVFEPVPVVSWGQAAQLAYQALPPEVQSGAPCKYFHVDVTEAEGVFEALFRPCWTAGCEPQSDEAMDGEWRYRVYANGAVEAVGP